MQPATALSLCAAATICATPGECESHLDAAQWTSVTVLVIFPIVLAMLLPRAACQPRDPVPHAALTTTVAGIFVVIVVMSFGFLPTFFLLLASDYPCASPLSSCGSVSCACGMSGRDGLHGRGYVWMFVMLVLTSLMLVRAVASMPGRRSRRARWRKRALTLGALLLAFTGVFPEHFATTDHTAPTSFFLGVYALHGLGILSMMVCWVFVPLGWLVGEARRLGWRSRLRPLAARAAHALTLLVYLITYASFHTHADVSDYCAPIGDDAAACAAWPSLAPAACDALAGTSMAGHRIPVPYRCTYTNRSLSAADRILLPDAYARAHSGECKKGPCTLYANARSVSLEWGALFLLGVYVGSYALHDVRRLLAIAEAEAEEEAEGETVVVHASRHEALLRARASIDASAFDARGGQPPAS